MDYRVFRREGSSGSFVRIATLAKAIVGPAALDEVVHRLVFIVACGNNDAHLKNWSLVYPDGTAI